MSRFNGTHQKVWGNMKNSGQTDDHYYRRIAKQLGLELKKSRGRKWSIDNQLGYRIINPSTNTILLGEKYDLDLSEVASFLEDYLEEQIGE
jgi:hypothetical protein